jgi:adenosylcobyric acid synthase
VSVRYVETAGELGKPDMVILPGTKSTMEDLLWMRQSGLEALILKLADRRVPVWGICGGYQMMGELLVDEEQAESEGRSRTAGMGLLPLKTVFQKEKVRCQAEGAFGELDGVFSALSGKSFSGYEIHMGRTAIDRENGAMDTARLVGWRAEPEICRPLSYVMEHGEKRAKEDGWNRGNVYGTYVHGIFDAPGVAETVVKALAEKKGLRPEEIRAVDYKEYKEAQYQKLADELRKCLDMEQIYQIMGIR